MDEPRVFKKPRAPRPTDDGKPQCMGRMGSYQAACFSVSDAKYNASGVVTAPFACKNRAVHLLKLVSEKRCQLSLLLTLSERCSQAALL